jgi:long-chain fatty acid transport protein
MSEFNDYAGLFAEEGNFDVPSNWNLGLAWKLSGTSAVTFDIQRINYSDVDSVANSVTNITQGGNLFGSDNGPGFGWDDMTVYKLGYQWKLAGLPDWTWRVGFSHGDQPIPDKEVTLNILAPAVVENHITFGFSKEIAQNTEFSFAFMHAFSEKVKGNNAFDPGQEVEIEMNQYEWDVGLSWQF